MILRMRSKKVAAFAAVALFGSASAMAVRLNPRGVASNGISQFGFELFGTLHDAGGKDPVAISPMCIAEALTLTTLGSEKETREQLESLFLPGKGSARPTVDVLATGIKNIRKDLTEFAKNSQGTFEFTSANALWGNNNSDIQFQFKPDFLKVASRDFDAEVKADDFGDKATVGKINQWVEGNTGGKIKDLLSELKAEDVAVLLNAMYAKGKFKTHFGLLSEGSYTDSKGSKHDVTQMTKVEDMAFLENSDIKLFSFNVEESESMPTKFRDQVALDILVSKDGKLDTLVSKLDANTYHQWIADSKQTKIQLTLPAGKVQQKESTSIKAPLMAAPFNLERPFDESRAQFTTMGTVRDEANLFVSDVLTKTFYEVTPFGFEAAAATAVIMARETAVGLSPEKHVIDGPSVHVIRHIPTGTPLFIAVYDTPVRYTQDEMIDLMIEGDKNGAWLRAETKDGMMYVGEDGDGKVVVLYKDGKKTVLKKL